MQFSCMFEKQLPWLKMILWFSNSFLYVWKLIIVFICQNSQLHLGKKGDQLEYNATIVYYEVLRHRPTRIKYHQDCAVNELASVHCTLVNNKFLGFTTPVGSSNIQGQEFFLLFWFFILFGWVVFTIFCKL